MVDERQNIVQKTSSGKAWKEGRVDELVAKTNSDIDLKEGVKKTIQLIYKIRQADVKCKNNTLKINMPVSLRLKDSFTMIACQQKHVTTFYLKQTCMRKRVINSLC